MAKRVIVIGAGIVEVDGLLHEAEAENAGIEVKIAGRIASNCSDVVNARHGRSFLPSARDIAV